MLFALSADGALSPLAASGQQRAMPAASLRPSRTRSSARWDSSQELSHPVNILSEPLIQVKPVAAATGGVFRGFYGISTHSNQTEPLMTSAGAQCRPNELGDVRVGAPVYPSGPGSGVICKENISAMQGYF